MQRESLKDSKIKIIMTGGHARATAYAVVEEINRRHHWQLYWAGSKEVFVGEKIDSMESRLFPKIGVEFLPVVSGRIQRKFTNLTIFSLLKIPIGFLYAIYYLIKIKPKLLISFGGYTSFPFVFISWLFGIPILIHEQTAAAGRANILASKLAGRIALARKESMVFFSKSKCEVIGNPISDEVKNLSHKNLKGEPSTILITGGSSGSKIINDNVKVILIRLLEKYKVIHQTGELQFRNFFNIRKNLPLNIRKKYIVFPTVYPWEWYKYLNQADIIVSRAGANIVSEIMVTKKPSILIPIKFAYNNEQLKNALIAKQFGIAKIVNQDDLNSETLISCINDISNNWIKIIGQVGKKNSDDVFAAEKFVNMAESMMTH